MATTQSPVKSIKLGLLPNSRYRFFINWGDDNTGELDEFHDITTGIWEHESAIYHTYAEAGDYTIKISSDIGGLFPGLASLEKYGPTNDPAQQVPALSSDQIKYLRVNKWGNSMWGSNALPFGISYTHTGTLDNQYWTPTTPYSFYSAEQLQLPLDTDTAYRQTTDIGKGWAYCTRLSSFPYLKFDYLRAAYHAWNSCVSLSSFPLLNFSTCATLDYAWYNCVNLRYFPPINTQMCQTFLYTWRNCHALTAFPFINSLSGSKSNAFIATWQACSSLKSFPLIDVRSGFWPNPANPSSKTLGYCRYTWRNCRSLSSFPAIDFQYQDNFDECWNGCHSMIRFDGINVNNQQILQDVDNGDYRATWGSCSSLSSFPHFDFLSGTNFESAWTYCKSLSYFPSILMSSVKKLDATWAYCFALTSFPYTNFDTATSIQSTWAFCKTLTSFPTIDFPAGISLRAAWQGCSAIENFPSIKCPKTKDLSQTWYGCHSLTQFGMLSAPLCEKFIDTWRDCGIKNANENVGGTLTAFEVSHDTFSKMLSGHRCFSGVRLLTRTWSSILTSLCCYNINENVVFNGGTSKRNVFGTEAYYSLITPVSDGGRGWTITDGGPEFDFTATFIVPFSTISVSP